MAKTKNYSVITPIRLNEDGEIIQKLKLLFSLLDINFLTEKKVYLSPYPCNEVVLDDSMCYNCSYDGDDIADEEHFQYSFFLHATYGLIPLCNLLSKSRDYSVTLEYVIDKFLQCDKRLGKTGKVPQFLVGFGKFKAGDLKSYEGVFITEIRYQDDGYFQAIRKRSGKEKSYLNKFLSFVNNMPEKAQVMNILPVCKCVKKEKEEPVVKESVPPSNKKIDAMKSRYIKKMSDDELKLLIQKTNKDFEKVNKFIGPWKRKLMIERVRRYDLLLNDPLFLGKLIAHV